MKHMYHANGQHLQLPGPAAAGYDAGKVTGGTQTWTWPNMSTDHQGEERDKAPSTAILLNEILNTE